MFINYPGEKKKSKLISSKYLCTCSLPASSFSLPQRKANKGNKKIPAKPATSKTPTQHCWRHHIYAKPLSLARAPASVFSGRRHPFSRAISQRSRGGGQRRLRARTRVSSHPPAPRSFPTSMCLLARTAPDGTSW